MSLTSISPIDGRYREKVLELSPFVSEFGLIKARLEIEAKYLFALSKLKIIRLSPKEKDKLLKIVKDFGLNEAEKIKETEEKLKHDVKATEVYLKNGLKSEASEMIHFGLTSEDINNISYRLMLSNANLRVIIPYLKKLNGELTRLSKKYSLIPMLGRTHGQNAVPTTLGKEFAVFKSRLNPELNLLAKTGFRGKLNGAIGNYNALHFSYPEINWVRFSKDFVGSFGFKINFLTTQVNSNEDLIEFFQNLERINLLLIDLNQDLWRYISDGWIILTSGEGQVGSSTMPQKINPIDFENSEGNLKLANGIMEVFARELSISRLQRDLSGSTVLRNIGVALAHSLLAYKSLLLGLSKISVNKDQVSKDLNDDWSILSEALQTILRLEKTENSYSKVIELTKGRKMNQADWKILVSSFNISSKNKQRLLRLTPSTYLGLASKLARQ